MSSNISMAIPYLYFLFNFIYYSYAIIGNDCSNQITNMTTISLVDINDCDIEPDPMDITLVDVHLLQLNDFEHTEIL